MWTFVQSTGQLIGPLGGVVATGYSGHDEGLNNPDAQNIPDVGPIPQGSYEIGEPIDSESHGPYVLPLHPMAGTETWGRDGFLMHGDSVEHAGQHLASLGCVIMPRMIREMVWGSADHILKVVAGLALSA